MKRAKKGITLMELLLVMVIIATLVAGIIITFGCSIRAKAFKAKAMETLRPIVVADHAYYQEYSKYSNDLKVLYTEGLLSKDYSGVSTPFAYSGTGGEWTATKGGDPFSGATVTLKQDGTIDENGWTCN